MGQSVFLVAHQREHFSQLAWQFPLSLPFAFCTAPVSQRSARVRIRFKLEFFRLSLLLKLLNINNCDDQHPKLILSAVQI